MTGRYHHPKPNEKPSDRKEEKNILDKEHQKSKFSAKPVRRSASKKKQSMKYKVLLFDLDGTLSDSKIGITKSVQHAPQISLSRTFDR